MVAPSAKELTKVSAYNVIEKIDVSETYPTRDKHGTMTSPL